MLSKCLNSCCSATFQYLRQGRLFRIDFADASRRSACSGRQDEDSRPSKARSIEHFWLCEKCAATLTLKVSDAGEVSLIPFGVLAEQPPGVPAVQTYESREATAP
jgi:hypothetical protein